jgi:voltage-gated potassium channel
MVVCIVVSIVPLAFKSEYPVFSWIDGITCAVFVFDYVARWMTADLVKQVRRHPFARYPFQPMAIIDMISILPSVTMLSSGFRLFKVFRLFRTLRVLRTVKVLRVFKLARYSRSIRMIGGVFKAQKDSLLTVLGLSLAYILISALIVFNVEPQTFGDFFEAVYWATISLTTMGYGDIYPVTAVGRFVTILSSLLGIAIVALPAGIVTAGYIDELKKERERHGKKKKSTNLAQTASNNETEKKVGKIYRSSNNEKRKKSKTAQSVPTGMHDVGSRSCRNHPADCRNLKGE